MPSEGLSTSTTWRTWFSLPVLLLPTLVVTMDISVLFLAVPHMSADLQPGATQLLWITDVYGFLIAGFLVTMGTLGDRLGRRRFLVIGAAAFAVASLVAAYSTTAEMLIVARALLGLAGATLMPSTLALITVIFPDARRRARAIGLWVTTMSVGVSIGPLAGGALLSTFWWGAVFLPGAAVMAIVVVTAPRSLPEHRNPGPARLDLFSVLLSMATIMPIVYGFKEIPGQGWTADVLLMICAGLVAGALFVWRQRTLTFPLVDVQLFRSRAFSAALALLLFGMVAINGMEYLYPQYLQMVSGLSPLAAGLWTVPGALAVTAGSMVTPRLTRWMSPGYIVGIGAGVAAAGFVLMSRVDVSSGLAILVVGLVVAQLGIAPIIVLGTDLVVGAAPPERSGSAAAVSETSGELGVALGIAVMGTLAAGVYSREMAGSVPAEIPDDLAGSANDTLAGAVDAAAQVSDGVGEQLLGAAHDAFARGFGVAAGLSAVICAGLAVLAATFLRRVQRRDEDEPDTADDGHA
ncbi:MFS transporter [Actinobacteria bacterium YIM 96077]|uniref:MFS transporter n=1 Tax=Phytoactinopolyspora halophila TaxID=1981511 RepID=A0A329R1Z3_9ACTN|nr:MFS transporter [Phytoactinopolyspora halophila]AYY12176.1 MFS transporter [Actinobacteria bacterium YIM 96077]RAW18590.1 MFS transporter [Phytoactinopolyspora halophila]